MHKLKSLLIVLVFGCFISNSHAVLEAGADAPDFTTDAALGGNVSAFTLSEALKKGPVVVYFYPKAFTKGCTVEAHMFAEATDEFAAMQTTVIGLSNDDIDTLKKFSVEECRNKFAVGADPESKIIKSYDVQLMPFLGTSSRTSYVITPDRKVFYVYKSMSADDHVKNTLDAVKRYQLQKK
jgi:peroxiredoxin Q/BCP